MKSWGLCLLFSWLSIWFMSGTIFIYRLRVRMGLKNISEFNFEDLPAFRQLCNPNSPSMSLGFILAFMLCQTQLASCKGLEQRRHWQPTSVLLPRKSHGWRILVGCCSWGCEESDTTERLHFHFSLLCIGEGNGNPLQCSCLQNPRDRGAWWAAVYGVSQSQTRLKRLSSSSKGLEKVKDLRPISQTLTYYLFLKLKLKKVPHPLPF